MSKDLPEGNRSELILFRSDDAQTRIQVRLEGDSVWLAQAQLAELFQVTVKTISEHLQNIYNEAEIEPERTIRKLRIVQSEGGRQVRRLVDHYHLDAILAVGYRVRSARGAQFRQWASARLGEYIVKGHALDVERFKRGTDDGYFEELLAKIRDIRSSEKMFWRKVLDIYATSIDYDANAETTQQFFATVQNKMHWAAHGHTAAELIALRVDPRAPNMGLTSWTGASSGARVRKADVSIAKNYLNADELETLNRMVNAYIEVAELQASARQPMTMHQWTAELDNFLRMTRKDILTHAGAVSAEAALAKAQQVYALYQQQALNEPSQVEKDFEAVVAKPVKQLEKSRKPLPGKPEGTQ